MGGERTRFPASVYRHGAEPDARFSLANERTFLAWIRTGLAFLAAGLALELLGLDLHAVLRLSAALTLIATGAVVPVLAWIGWARTERAMRGGDPLPSSSMAPVVGAAVVVTGVLLLLAIVLR